MYEEHEIIDETPEESRSELQTPKPVTVETNPQDDKKPSRNHTEVITDNPTTGEEVTSQLDFELHITVKEKKVTVSANEKQSGQLVKRPPLIGRETTQKANDIITILSKLNYITNGDGNSANALELLNECNEKISSLNQAMLYAKNLLTQLYDYEFPNQGENKK